MQLFIAEKPSMAREIAKCLGEQENENGYIKIKKSNCIVTWCFGHILRQKNPDEYDKKYEKWDQSDLPIIPQNWQLIVGKGCKNQLTIIKKLLLDANEIVNAGDPDREGQLLIDEVLDYLNNHKKVKRLLLNALDEKSINKALNNLRDNEEFAGLKKSALARSRADWLIGMNFSRAYTMKLRESGLPYTANIGRVKTPTMALVVRRENEINNFTPTTHFKLEAIWDYKNNLIKSTWQPKKNCQYLNENGLIIRSEFVNNIEAKIQNAGNAVLKEVNTETINEHPRLPYSLSSLQIDAGKKYGYEPQKVLDVVQKLYEQKLTSYPRSDCDYLPENQFADAREIMDGLVRLGVLSSYAKSADLSLKGRSWNDKKISAHHAIIPTSIHCNLEKLSDVEQKIYCLISKAYIAQFYPDYIYDRTKAIIYCANENFAANGKVEKQLGWKIIYKTDEQTHEKENTLPDIRKGEYVKYNSTECLTVITKPPLRFTPSTLLQAMKEIHKYVQDNSSKAKLKSVSGIGTEATRAKIIDDLITKGFFVTNKKQLLPSELAQTVIKILPDSMTYPDKTAGWEDELEQIANNQLDYNKFLQEQIHYVITTIKNMNEMQVEIHETGYKCPNCGSSLIRRKGTKGYFWSCSAYPKCVTAFPDIKNKPAIYKCSKCDTGYLRRLKSKSGKGYFWSCNKYPECKTIYKDKNGKPEI